MVLFEISVWQMLLALVAYMAIGSLWYSVVFGNVWLKAVGKSKAEAAMGGPAMLGAVFGEAMVVLGLAYVNLLVGVSGWMSGALLGVIMWLFFVTGTALVNSAFQGKSLQLYLIDMGYHLVGMMVAGAILAM